MAALVFVVLGGVLLPGAVLAGTPECREPDYGLRPLADQAEPPRAGFNPILLPASSAPALVAWGEEFTVRVVLPGGAQPGGPEHWLVVLNTRSQDPRGRRVGDELAAHYQCPVLAVEPAGTNQVRLRVLAPAAAPRDTYHLELSGPGGLLARRVYAVRVLGNRPRRLRVAVLADSQLRDPTTDFGGAALNSGDWPRCCEDDAESMFRQQVREIAFWDPDLVLYLGDLVFGVDYSSEYADTLQDWWREPLATFFVPGNHDGLALYRLALRERWWQQALRSLRCLAPLASGEVDAAKVFRVLGCALGDLKKILFEDLAQDGLDYFRRWLGPADVSWRVAGIEFVGMNSYAGTAERRHAFVLGLDFLGLEAAAVDNYGGTLSERQLAWLEGRLRRARSEGRPVVLYLHHDPRGTRGQAWGRGYHANLPFPTEPLGLRTFQEWNYESSEWDSNPNDGRAAESPRDNSAVRLLRLIAEYVDVVLTGHIHDDEDTVIEPGQELVAGSGIRARHRLHFIRVTTGSATPEDDQGYWGYRLLEFTPRGLERARFRPDFGWASVPSGNLWLVGKGTPPLFAREPVGKLLYAVHNGLPVPARGRLRAWLPAFPEGINLRVGGAGRAAVVDVGRPVRGQRLYLLEVEVPAVRAGRFPVRRGDEQVLRLEWQRARGNRAPVARFEARPLDGAPLAWRFTGVASHDPEKRPLIRYLWDFGDGHDARGVRVEHRYAAPGRYLVRLEVTDEHGSSAAYSTTLEVTPVSACAVGRSTCVAGGLALPLLALLLAWWLRRRRWGRRC